jgi:hypothetical protein
MRRERGLLIFLHMGIIIYGSRPFVHQKLEVRGNLRVWQWTVPGTGKRSINLACAYNMVLMGKAIHGNGRNWGMAQCI